MKVILHYKRMPGEEQVESIHLGLDKIDPAEAIAMAISYSSIVLQTITTISVERIEIILEGN